MKIKSFFQNVKNWFVKASWFKKIILIIVVVGLLWFGVSRFIGSKKNQTQYQTATAQKGTLIVTVTGSGQVSTANNGTITTQASGVVSKLYVKDGDEVKSGDKIADIDLDMSGQQNFAQVSSSYQSAKNSLDMAKANSYTTQSDMFTQWQKFYNLATNSTYQNSDGSPNYTNRALAEFHISEDNWLASEAKYKEQQNAITQAQTSLNSAWLSYLENSPTIYAPISGVVSGLSLQEGSVIVASQNTSSSNSSQNAQKIATIKTKALPMVSVNLTEIDIPKIKLGDKATIAFDAFPNQTYTGKIISIDTSGVISSGVTNYPTVIRLDTESDSILPNMAATVYIITETKNDVLMVPVAAVLTQNGQSTVRVLKNGKEQTVNVEVGSSSNTETEITSGLSEGDTVITNITSSTTSTSSTGSSSSRSVFSSFGGGARGGFGR